MTSGLSTFLGAPMMQVWGDLALWERVLNEAPQLTEVIEVGTGSGAFSLFLLLQCRARGLDFRTIDRQFGLRIDAGLCEALEFDDCYFLDDVFREGVAPQLFARKRATSGRPGEAAASPVLVFCDNGNKPAEVRTFAPLLAKGDVLAVHDWGTEIKASDLECMGSRLVKLAEGAMTAWFEVVG